MNSKKIRSVFATILPFLILIQACTNKPDPVANSPQATGSPKADKSTKLPTGEKTPTPTANIDSEKAAKLTNEAKFLAGIKGDENGQFAASEKTAAWKDHASYFDGAWDKLNKQQIAKIKSWSDKELKSINESPQPIFYPFSGPDFLYGFSFFPKGSNYILVGLEPVGTLPDLDQKSEKVIDQKLQDIEKALGAILQLSFFRTNDMKVDLADKGVVPILFVFLARTDNKIVDLNYIRLKKDGTWEVEGKDKKDSQGVKIDFVSKGDTQPRSLYYFSVDLSNDGLQKNPEFNKFVQSFGKSTTYLKAASYLMHNEEFSTIRNLITSQSSTVLQDDSGIPLKNFDPAKWNLEFYGNYTQPIALFSNRYQDDLRSKYKSGKDIKPLDFGIGYQYEVNTSNLMLATSK